MRPYRIGGVFYLYCMVWASVCICAPPLVAGTVSRELEQVLNSAGPEDLIPIILTFRERVDTTQFQDRDLKVRRVRLVQALRHRASGSLNSLLNLFSWTHHTSATSGSSTGAPCPCPLPPFACWPTIRP
ncbi:MAG: hypothetical protein HY788_03510 [Deltaproteobacteria bacterium]|nr:hypothetical protein [Deltaproteobacteria bacterium]